jgi:hypothetical protein
MSKRVRDAARLMTALIVAVLSSLLASAVRAEDHDPYAKIRVRVTDRSTSAVRDF